MHDFKLHNYLIRFLSSGRVLLQGNAAYKKKEWNKAVSYYTEAIKLNKGNATFYSNRAAAYLELGWYAFSSVEVFLCGYSVLIYVDMHY